MKINIASITDQGKVRNENQDCLIINEELNLYCVSDGMGGLAYGKATAEIVKDQMNLYFDLLCKKNIEINCENVENIIKKISHNIQIMGNVENGQTLYGATLTGMIFKDDHAILMNVGDSRVYRCCDGKLVQMTKDQSLVQRFVDQGKITQEEARKHPMRNMILEFMGKAPSVHPIVNKVQLNDYEIYCICSDGLFSMVEESRIQEILESNQLLNDKCQQLVKEANDAGGKDNISIVLVERSTL